MSSSSSAQNPTHPNENEKTCCLVFSNQCIGVLGFLGCLYATLCCNFVHYSVQVESGQDIFQMDDLNSNFNFGLYSLRDASHQCRKYSWDNKRDLYDAVFLFDVITLTVATIFSGTTTIYYAFSYCRKAEMDEFHLSVMGLLYMLCGMFAAFSLSVFCSNLCTYRSCQFVSSTNQTTCAKIVCQMDQGSLAAIGSSILLVGVGLRLFFGPYDHACFRPVRVQASPWKVVSHGGPLPQREESSSSRNDRGRSAV